MWTRTCHCRGWDWGCTDLDLRPRCCGMCQPAACMHDTITAAGSCCHGGCNAACTAAEGHHDACACELRLVPNLQLLPVPWPTIHRVGIALWYLHAWHPSVRCTFAYGLRMSIGTSMHGSIQNQLRIMIPSVKHRAAAAGNLCGGKPMSELLFLGFRSGCCGTPGFTDISHHKKTPHHHTHQVGLLPHIG